MKIETDRRSLPPDGAPRACYICGMWRFLTPMRLFSIATLTPAVLLGMAAIYGGWWILTAVLFLTALTACLDEMVHHITRSNFQSPPGFRSCWGWRILWCWLWWWMRLQTSLWGFLPRAGYFYQPDFSLVR